MAKHTSLKNDKQPEKKDDSQVKIAVITGIVAIITVVITAIGGPVILKFIDRTPVPAGATLQPASTQNQPISITTLKPTDILPSTERPQASNHKPLSESSAIITDRNGAQTIVPADTLRWCISVGDSIPLDNGYTIALDTIERIDIVRASPPGGKTLFAITLLDNTVIEGEAYTCDFTGQTSAGNFALTTDKIQSIEIQR